jgi:hypothetical protein
MRLSGFLVAAGILGDDTASAPPEMGTSSMRKVRRSGHELQAQNEVPENLRW